MFSIKRIGGIRKLFQKGKKIKSEADFLLNCLEYRDGDYCIAHCLEFDIVAQGKTFKEARKQLAELIHEQILFAIEKDIEEKVVFHPAPKKYWDTLIKLRTRHAKERLLRHPEITTEEILDSLAIETTSLAHT